VKASENARMARRYGDSAGAINAFSMCGMTRREPDDFGSLLMLASLGACPPLLHTPSCELSPQGEDRQRNQSSMEKKSYD
jgi:hypothetical protein